MKTVVGTFGGQERHWVGDGFPVRSLFSYQDFGRGISPFLLLDYAGPHEFAAGSVPRGVGTHPHRGFETVTIVYDGEVQHQDSTGAGGIIGPGDVQWNTAGAGILHREFHSEDFTRKGGSFRMVQLWVNLPARAKPSAPGYQSLLGSEIPGVVLPGGAGLLRVIAGEYAGVSGPARTATPLNVWDARLAGGAKVTFPMPEDQNSMIVVLAGSITVNGSSPVREAEMALLSPKGQGVDVQINAPALLLALTGQPIDEPVVGQGPFVMNTREEIDQAMIDLRNGRFGTLVA